MAQIAEDFRSFELQVMQLKQQKFQVEYLKKKQAFLQEIAQLKDKIAVQAGTIQTLTYEVSGLKDKEAELYS